MDFTVQTQHNQRHKNMPNNPNSIVLIGMPGAGKSTLGILLAKELGLDFVDTDIAIQVREGRTLQEILDDNDYLYLREIEEQVLLSEDVTGKVVATGGSAVYSAAGMARLKQIATVVFLDVPLEALRKRIGNFDVRGIARKPNQSLESLFDERCALYKKYGDIRVDCDQQSLQQSLDSVLQRLQA
jgi:shikimate kinase